MSHCIICNSETTGVDLLCKTCNSSWNESINRKTCEEEKCVKPSEVLIKTLNEINSKQENNSYKQLNEILSQYNLLQCLDVYNSTHSTINPSVRSLIINILCFLAIDSKSAKTNFYQLIIFDYPLQLLSVHNEEFRNNVNKYLEDINKDIQRIKHRKNNYLNLSTKLKHLRSEMLMLEITTGLLLLTGISAYITGLLKGIVFATVIIYVILFIILKLTRYKDINLDLSLPSNTKYRLYEYSVNDEYLTLIEQKAIRLNQILTQRID